MREIAYSEIVSAVSELCIRAATALPPEIAMKLEIAEASEPCEAAKSALKDIIENYKIAFDQKLAICQDTGMAVVFAEIGQEVHFTGGLFNDAVNEGVRRGYTEGHLRCSVVEDPFRRTNTNDNTPAVIHTTLVEGDRVRITVAPKGFGSENKSAMKMFLPADPITAIEDFVCETMKKAGPDPCPPVVIGVGVGGTIEKAAELAKAALVRDGANPDPFYAQAEKRALAKVNAIGTGAAGYGGRNTALSVNIEAFPTHIAGLPCVVNIGCHATRHAFVEI